MRSSIIKRIPLNETENLDIVKSNHFVDRDTERGIYGIETAVEKVMKVYAVLLGVYRERKQVVEGVIKVKSGMNIVYSVEPDKMDGRNIDIVLQTIIIKKNFIAKNKTDYVLTVE